MLGIVPAAGSATRMQPLGGSKELLPLGRHSSTAGQPGRMRVVADYLIERMLLAGADRICLIVSAEKSDLIRYYARSSCAERIFFAAQPEPAGLCDAVFRAAPLVQPGEPVLVGLPDTVWYPRTAFAQGLRDSVHLITFPVSHPEEFDAVLETAPGVVSHVEVKQPGAAKRRVWGAITAPGEAFLRLEQLWRARGRRDLFLGDLFNAWMADGEPVSCDQQGTQYWDIGTPAGYERALRDRVWVSEEEVARPPRTRDALPLVGL
ncbi:MAG: sugar phosphate nucleotidyltransferase [Terriglobales bacterium]